MQPDMIPDGRAAGAWQVRAVVPGRSARGVGAFRLTPVLRACVTGVTGRDTQLRKPRRRQACGSLAREHTVT